MTKTIKKSDRPRGKSMLPNEWFISVIIPVYNAGLWIGDCIESLKRQKQEGLEFIFVDDCGKDDSMEAVAAWAAEDERVRIIRNEENIGAGPSRNVGIEAARGEYLSFIDPDDWVSDDFYERLYDKAKDTGQDIIKGRRLRVYDSTEKVRSESLFSRSKTNEIIKARLRKNIPLYVCFASEHQSAIYKSTLINDNNVRYGSTKYSEDLVFLLKACYETEKIVVIEDAVYYYRKHFKAATSKYTINRSTEELKAMEESLDFLEEKQDSDHKIHYMKTRIKMRLARYCYAIQNDNISSKQQREYVDRFSRLIDRIDHHPILFQDYPELTEFLETGRITSQNIKISVIIPMYKCAAFVDSLLDSVCGQSLRDTEIICVLDGADEEIRAIVEKHAKTDSRIICIEQMHSGAGAARNAGLKKARGAYLLFLDVDGLFEKHMFEKMYTEAAKWDADIVICSYTEINQWNKTCRTDLGFNHEMMPENCVLNPRRIPNLLSAFTGASWNKLFRRKMINFYDLRFSDTIIMNDDFFVTAAMVCTERLVAIHEDLLTVRRHGYLRDEDE